MYSAPHHFSYRWLSNGQHPNFIQRHMPMVNHSLLLCEQCGYENFRQHRFCGMCGARLASSDPVETRTVPDLQPEVGTTEASPPHVTSALSFLGLEEYRENDTTSYLLEDDQNRSHRGRYLILMLLVAVLAVVGWHGRQDLGGLATRFTNRWANQNTSTPPPSTQSSSTSETMTPTANGQETLSKTEDVSAQGQPGSSESNATYPLPNASSGADSIAKSASLAAQPTEAARAATVRPGGIPRAVSASAKEASSETTDDSLEEVGEKYLYGTGVPQDCARAQSSLLTAAENSNVKAESVLGAMYATGHCVIRDLPLSYRWFARALQQEPRNPRIERDLAVIWHQMTPQEQQLAMHSGQ